MSHYYNKQGELVPPWTPGAYPSPTTILDILRKPDLEAYRSRVGEDTANELMTAAQERGTRVHKACEVWLENGGGFEGAVMHAELEGDEPKMLQGFINWWTKYQPELVECEVFLISEKYKYAGRCDLIVLIDGELWIIDLKTGAHRPTHGLQLRYYEQAYFEMTGKHARMGVLGLTTKTKQGYHKVKEYDEPLRDALMHKAVFDWHARKTPAKPPAEVKKWEMSGV